MPDLRRLIVRQIPHLRRYARALTGDRDRADDLVQDCLERAWSHTHQWRPDSNMRSWLFTIMHNVNANHRRAESRRPKTAAFDEAHGASATRPAQEDGLALSNLADALATLPAEQRAVVILVGLDGLAYAEAAAVLDVPVGTLMSRLSRGRARLRELMSGDASERPTLERVK